jgi:hypothetical protein
MPIERFHQPDVIRVLLLLGIAVADLVRREDADVRQQQVQPAVAVVVEKVGARTVA